MLDALVIAVTDTIWTRLGVCGVAWFLGVCLIAGGIERIRTRTEEETGIRRLANRALGRSSTYTCARVARTGWAYLVMGILCFIFGIVFIFVGPFLAE